MGRAFYPAAAQNGSEMREDRDHGQSERTFEQQAHQPQPSIWVEFADFLRHNKKWWLTPIVVILLLLASLVILGGSGIAPFIYPLF